MNRQRRLEAIARRRALIDSQLRMLSDPSVHEVRLPNIIRNRGGGRLPRSNTTTASLIKTEIEMTPSPSRHMGTIFQDSYPHKIVKTEKTSKNTKVLARNVVSAAGSATNALVPVDISDKIASIIASNNGDIFRSFQTIETEDGTVMVVIEGDGNSEDRNEANGTEIIMDTENSDTDTAESLPPVDMGDDEQLFFAVPEEHGGDASERGNGSGGESYIIVQAEDGTETLVPSSTYSQEIVSVVQEDRFDNFLATESIKMEEQITNNLSPSVQKMFSSVSFPAPPASLPAKKPRPNLSCKRKLTAFTNKPTINVNRSQFEFVTRLQQNVPSPQFQPNVGVRKVKVNEAKIKAKPFRKKIVLNDETRSKPKSKVLNSTFPEEEKPRPFRFDLPELEEVDDPFKFNNNNFMDNLMTVPVPIKIDSLRSETERKYSTNSISLPEKKVSYRAKSLDKTKDSTLSCGKCSKAFSRSFDLLQHVKKNHTTVQTATGPSQQSPSNSNSRHTVLNKFYEEETQTPIISGKEQDALTFQPTSHCVQPSTVVDLQKIDSSKETVEHFLLPGSVCAVATEDGETVYFQIVDDETINVNDEAEADEEELEHNQYDHDHSNVGVMDSNTIGFEIDDGQMFTVITSNSSSTSHEDLVHPTGRRTLNKATAKADMSALEGMSNNNGIFIVGNEVLVPVETVVKNNNNVINYDGDTISVQAARIRARNDRTKAMSANDNKKEELNVNFKNIFQQVVKQEVTYY